METIPDRVRVVSIADPPFVQFKGHGACVSIEPLGGHCNVMAVLAIRKALKDPEIQPALTRRWAKSTLYFDGQVARARVPSISLLRNSELSVQQLANNNVLYIGSQVFFETLAREATKGREAENFRPVAARG
jgi:hypothetical protein